MKRLALVMLLLGVFGCGDSRPRPQDNVALTASNIQHEPLSNRTAESPTSIIHEALRLEAAGDTEKAALLEEMAFARMRRSPSDVPAVWQLLKTQIERFKENPVDYASRLDVFLAEVRGALSECQTITEFSTVWDVHEEIQVALQQTHRDLYAIALEELARASRVIAGPSTSFLDDITTLVSMRSSAPSSLNAQVLASVLSSSLAAWDEEDAPADRAQPPDANLKRFHDAVAALVTSILGKAETFLTTELDELTQEAERDKRGEPVEPVPGTAGGTYQQAIVSFQGLQAAIETADLASWSLIAQADFLERIENIGARLAELPWKATELQGLRYNIWALRQIRLADSAQSWPDILGSIDLYNLDPSVSSLYSLTYDDLVRRESDPLRRDACVRTLLSKDKTRLEQF